MSWCVGACVVCALEAIDVVTSGTISISELCEFNSELQELVNIAQQVEDYLRCIHHKGAVAEDRLMCVRRTLSQCTRVMRLHPPCVLELHELHTGWAHIFAAAFLKRFSVHSHSSRRNSSLDVNLRSQTLPVAEARPQRLGAVRAGVADRNFGSFSPRASDGAVSPRTASRNGEGAMSPRFRSPSPRVLQASIPNST